VQFREEKFREFIATFRTRFVSFCIQVKKCPPQRRSWAGKAHTTADGVFAAGLGRVLPRTDSAQR
jgi:hypothetical protein